MQQEASLLKSLRLFLPCACLCIAFLIIHNTTIAQQWQTALCKFFSQVTNITIPWFAGYVYVDSSSKPLKSTRLIKRTLQKRLLCSGFQDTAFWSLKSWTLASATRIFTHGFTWFCTCLWDLRLHCKTESKWPTWNQLAHTQI